MSSTIPKRIIQTWKSAALPRPLDHFTAHMRALHHDFDYQLFTDNSAAAFVSEHYPEHRQAYATLRTPVERADLFRVLAVHKLGGFYFDLDVLLTRPLHDLLDRACVFPFETMADPFTARAFGIQEQLGQYAFAARPNHPLLAEYARNICTVALDPGRGAPEEYFKRHPSPTEVNRIILSTGPGMLARTLGERPDLATDLDVISAVDGGSGKRLLYCFGAYGSHAMLGGFGWRNSVGRSGMLRSAVRYVRWRQVIRAARQRALVVAAATASIERWQKPGDL